MNKFLTILLVFISTMAFSQAGGVSLGPNGALPDPSSILDLNTPNRGFLMPRIGKPQRDSIANPALGLQIFDTTTKCIEMYGYGNWQTISCLCNGAPSAPSTITGNNSPCANATSITYTVGLVLAATSYSWTVPSNAAIIAGQGTNSVTVNFGPSPGNVTVSANNSCGASGASTLAITIDTIPGSPGVMTGNPYPCANSSAQPYSVLPVSGATSYTWSVPSGSIVAAGQGTNSALVNFATTPGNLAVTANNACGASSASILPITMANTPSTPGNLNGPANFNSNQTLAYSITPVTEATSYTWTIPGDATITTGQGTDSVTIAFGSASYDNICVSAGNCAGTGSSNCTVIDNSCYSPGTQTFSYTGSLQTFTVPQCVYSITIEAWGAQGGSTTGQDGGGNWTGGLGADIKGTFSVTNGQAITILVGGQGSTASSCTAGGGGGSWAVSSGSLLLVAGGGGGGFDCEYYGGTNGGNGQAGPSGGNGVPAPTASAGATGGANGNGGIAPSWGSGGGGWLSSGGNGCCSEGGQAYPGSAVSYGGGYGGGGGGNSSCCDGSGGGGGYSGGSAGSSDGCAGGGGGSYNSGTNPTNTGGVQSGNGQMVITW